MGEFEAGLVKRLAELNNTDQSIRAVSAWVCHYPAEAAQIAQIWLSEYSLLSALLFLSFVFSSINRGYHFLF